MQMQFMNISRKKTAWRKEASGSQGTVTSSAVPYGAASFFAAWEKEAVELSWGAVLKDVVHTNYQALFLSRSRFVLYRSFRRNKRREGTRN